MCSHGLHEKAHKSFWYIASLSGVVITTAIVSLGYIAYSIYTNSHPLLTKIEESCGCVAIVTSVSNTSAIIALLSVIGGALLLFIGYILYKAFRLHNRTTHFISSLLESKKVIPSPILQGLADTLDLNDRIAEVRSSKAIVFTYGYFNPKIIISSKIIEELEIDELRAILEHEQEHMKAYDPLKIFISKIVSETLFFVPGLNTIVEQYKTLSELSADEGATNCFETKKNLAQALYKVLGLQEAELQDMDVAVSSFALQKIMGERVQVLFDSQYSPQITMFSKKTIGFVVALIALVSTFMINLPESQAHVLEERTSQCIQEVSERNLECRLVHEELCEQNYSSLQSQLCNKTF